ncbi:MAG: hypothetical protein QM752_04780 [Gammaproteobacteria bacterium]
MNELPQSIQQQILFYLEANNFRAAKELRDGFVSSQESDSLFDSEEEE